MATSRLTLPTFRCLVDSVSLTAGELSALSTLWRCVMRPEHGERISQLLAFLSGYDARRHPPVHNIAEYKLELLRDGELPESSAVRLTGGAETWLTVDFVELPLRPQVPEHLVPILGTTSQLSATHRPAVSLPARGSSSPAADDDLQGESEITEEEFEAFVEAEAWVNSTWQSWADRYLEISAVKRLHRRLFELREQYSADRDSLELVWGFGRLRWRTGGRVIDHPILTVPVEVEMADDTSQMTVRPAGGLGVETMYLSDVEEVDDRRQLNLARQALLDQEDAEDPWVSDTLRDIVVRLLRLIDQDGVLEGEGDAGATDATADLSWVLFLRRRRPDYQGFIDAMRELYEAGTNPPDPLVAIVADAPSELEEVGALDAGRELEPLLLPLPTNEQQQRILTEIQRRTGITVQGPPGTGKSHTIANIISHYVAYGKRVLVVAEKEQALGVVAEKVPAAIRDLTVSVLGADEVSRRRLESSIRAIQTRVTVLDRADSADAIKRLSDELDAIDRLIATTTGQLLSTRQGEVEAISGSWRIGQDPSPSQVGEWLARNAQELDYIEDHIELRTPPPVSGTELAEFLSLLDEVGLDRARNAGHGLPDPAQLPEAPAVREIWDELRQLRVSMTVAGGETVDWQRVDTCDEAELTNLLGTVRTEIDWLSEEQATWLERLAGQLTDPHLGPEWPDIYASLVGVRAKIIEISRVLDAHVVEVPENPDPAFVSHLREAQERLTERGKLGLFNGDLKQALGACKVDGRVPTTAGEAGLCIEAVTRLGLRREIVTRWANRIAHVSGPPLEGASPEIPLGQLLQQIERVISRPARLAEVSLRLERAGLRPPTRYDSVTLSELRATIETTALRRRERELQRHLDELQEYLTNGVETEGASPLWMLLRSSLTTADFDSWKTCRQECVELASIRTSAARLRGLHQRLQQAAPAWTRQISDDPSSARSATTFEAAWEWRQLDAHLRELTTSSDPSALQRQLEELANRRRRVVTELVAERAWLRLAENLGDRQLQALNAYLAAVRRFGKTGGKYAARWLAEIRRALNDAKDAVPVWVMTTSRALSSFRPSHVPPFDLLIIDEASQIGMQALPLFSLAQSAIIVGDDKQTSPENVGTDQASFFELLDEYLRQIPDYKLLFNLDNSLYDIAKMKFPAQTMLTEHFRSLPEIIDFSNTHVYDGKIIPLRDQPPVPGWRPLGSVKVVDGYRSGDLNEPEANAVVDLVEKLCADPEYDDMDFGVVSLLGSSQSKFIWDRLYDRLGPETLAARRIRCGEPANFQGDERDVMVVSLVAAIDPNNPTGRIGAMTKVSDQRRINVAASRACDQMWVVHSVDADRFSEGDLRGALIRHCQNPGALSEALDDLLSKCDSEFERLVLRRILARGYQRVRVQHSVGRYRIDIVVEGPDARLAVECDGDQWHGPDRWHQDRARQEVLERAGWTFERIRGSAFFRDPDSALEPLWRRLDELNISAGEQAPAAASRSTVLEVSGAGRNVRVDDDDSKEPGSRWAEDVDEVPRLSPRASVQAVINHRESELPQSIDFEADSSERTAEVPSSTTPPANTSPQGFNQVGLHPFTAWASRPLPEPGVAREEELINGLVEIVAAEGPMHAVRAYQLYVKASGGHRVGREMRRLFNRAMHRAVKTGRLVQIEDDLPGQADKTIYIPGKEPVVVRELGERQLPEVPRSEIRALATSLGYSGPTAEAKRGILDALGLIRLTDRASTYIDECLRDTNRSN